MNMGSKLQMHDGQLTSSPVVTSGISAGFGMPEHGAVLVADSSVKQVSFRLVRLTRKTPSWLLMSCAVAFKAVMFAVTLARLALTDWKSEGCGEQEGMRSHDSQVTAMHPRYTELHPVNSTHIRAYCIGRAYVQSPRYVRTYVHDVYAHTYKCKYICTYLCEMH